MLDYQTKDKIINPQQPLIHYYDSVNHKSFQYQIYHISLRPFLLWINKATRRNKKNGERKIYLTSHHVRQTNKPIDFNTSASQLARWTANIALTKLNIQRTYCTFSEQKFKKHNKKINNVQNEFEKTTHTQKQPA